MRSTASPRERIGHRVIACIGCRGVTASSRLIGRKRKQHRSSSCGLGSRLGEGTGWRGRVKRNGV